MYYCNDCAEKRDWPKTLFKSRGNCEICGKPAICNSTKSSQLSLPKKEKDNKQEDI